MERDIKALESGMRKLRQSCAELGSQKYFDEFLQIIHRPMLNEFFVGAMIANMQDQVQNVTKHLETLMEGARQVGR